MDVTLANKLKPSHLISYLGISLTYFLIIFLPGNSNVLIFGTLTLACILFYSARTWTLCAAATKPPPIPKPSTEQYPFVSIIICSFNEQDVLPATIPSLLNLDYDPNKIEFLYVYERDCTDNTGNIINSFAKHDTRIVPLMRNAPAGGKAAAANFGIKHAKGRIIAIFDADHFLDKDIVRKAVACFNDPKTACVRGRCRINNPNQNLLSKLVSVERDIVERIAIFGAYKLGGMPHFGGGHGFFAKSIFSHIGLFNEDVLTEDIHFSVRLHLAGFNIAVYPQLQSWEQAPTSLPPLVNQRLRWGRGWMQVWAEFINNIFLSHNLSIPKKLDMLVSLTSAVLAPVTILILPLLLLALAGSPTCLAPKQAAITSTLFVTLTPILAALWCWLLDQTKPLPPSFSTLAMTPLLIPFILFQFIINWIAFIDEFLLNKSFSYVKTIRTNSKSSPNPCA